MDVRRKSIKKFSSLLVLVGNPRDCGYVGFLIGGGRVKDPQGVAYGRGRGLT